MLGAAAALLPCAGCGDRPPRGAPLHFTDVTQESGVHVSLICGEDPPTRLVESTGSGAALFDYDNDGDDDLFLANGATLAAPGRGPGARLYRNDGGLRFTDVTKEAGINLTTWSFGVAVGDVDKDGFDDLFVASYGPNALLKNDGKGGFRRVTAGVEGQDWSAAAAFGDLDGDGDLDLYVANYVALPLDGKAPMTTFVGVQVYAGPKGLTPVQDFIYENLGDGTFRDRSVESGIRQAPPAFGLGVVIVDLDGDGRNDVYVGNDSMANYLFRNLGGFAFEEIGLTSGAALNEDGAAQATMGIALGDVDGNGWPDLFTTNFMYDTNTLHLNMGGMSFEDRTRVFGLHAPSRSYLAWGTGLVDFDHDGDEDLVVVSGHIYPEETCIEQNWDYRQEIQLYERKGERFELAAAASAGEWLAQKYAARSAAFADLDLDGDVDMVVTQRNAPVLVLRNDRDGGAWLQVVVDDRRREGAPRGLGSRVEVRAGEKAQVRWLASGWSFFAACPPVAHFGFAEGVGQVDVVVRTVDGEVREVKGVQVGQRVVVKVE